MTGTAVIRAQIAFVFIGFVYDYFSRLITAWNAFDLDILLYLQKLLFVIETKFYLKSGGTAAVQIGEMCITDAINTIQRFFSELSSINSIKK